MMLCSGSPVSPDNQGPMKSGLNKLAHKFAEKKASMGHQPNHQMTSSKQGGGTGILNIATNSPLHQEVAVGGGSPTAVSNSPLHRGFKVLGRRSWDKDHHGVAGNSQEDRVEAMKAK